MDYSAEGKEAAQLTVAKSRVHILQRASGILVRFFLPLLWCWALEASITKVSSKGQVVIPIKVREAANIKEGEKLLTIALGDTIILKKISDKTFEETVKSVWSRVRQIGLTEEDVNVIIQEARTKGSP
ncbi:MAG: AbrB/MazE/SpoVT family DNA-binding domain-containing protein [Candidatus Verstraetearchaeota archaeon]|nr:AbrB/MazE/SpoVT family DNA-binding domain-containing protein [Candidatus Verstraetearchaeota archaeon]